MLDYKSLDAAVKDIKSSARFSSLPSGSDESDLTPSVKEGLWKLLGYLDRPMQGVNNFLNALLTEEDTRNPFEAGYEGLTGKTETRLSDVARRAGVPELGKVNLPLLGDVTGRGTLAMIAEIFGDPLNLIGVGAATKAGRLAKTDDIARLFSKAGLPKGSSLGSTLAEQAARGQRAAIGLKMYGMKDTVSVLPKGLNKMLLSGADYVGDYVKTTLPYKMFAKPYGKDKYAAEVQRFGEAFAKNFSTDMVRDAVPILQTIRKVEKLTGQAWDKLAPTVMEIAEKGVDLPRFAKFKLITDPDVLSKLTPLADQFVGFNKMALKKLIKAGVPVAQLDPAYGLKYMKHVAEQGQELLEKAPGLNKMFGVGGTKNRVFHWSFNDAVDPSIFNNADVIKSGYIFKNNIFTKADDAADAIKQIRGGGEFRLSDKAAEGIFGSTRNKLFENIGAVKGASTVAEMGQLGALKALTPEAEQIAKLVADPLTSIAGTIYKSGRQAASAKMAREIAGNYDWVRVAGDHPAGWKAMGDQFGEALKGKFIRPDIHEQLVKNFDINKLDPASADMIERLGKVQGWWKAFTLAVPAYPARNMVSNFIQSMWGGLTSIKPHMLGGKFIMGGMYDEKLPVALLHKMFNKVQVFDIENFMKTGSIIKGYSNRQLWKLGRELGIADNDLIGRIGDVAELVGQFGGTSTRSIRKQIQSMAGETAAGLKGYNIASVEGPLIKNMNVINAAVEGQARMALWIDGMQKGMSPHESAMNVTKWLLDYMPGSLSATERKFIAPLIPFYKFMRRNTPNVFELLLTEPGKLMKTVRPFMAASGKIPPEEQELMPSWMKEGFPIKLSNDPASGQARIADLESYVPFTAPATMMKAGLSPTRWMQNLVSGVTPIVKLPFEAITNVNTFSGKPIQRYEGEMTEALGFVMTPMMRHLFMSIARPLKEIDAANIGNMFGEERLGRFAQPSQADRYITAATGLKVKIIDVGKLRAHAKLEKGMLISGLKHTRKMIQKYLWQPHSSDILGQYQRMLNINAIKLRDLGVNVYDDNEGETDGQ